MEDKKAELLRLKNIDFRTLTREQLIKRYNDMHDLRKAIEAEEECHEPVAEEHRIHPLAVKLLKLMYNEDTIK